MAPLQRFSKARIVDERAQKGLSERTFSGEKGVFAMCTDATEVKGTYKRGAWLWCRGGFALLMALLALGFVGTSTGVAASSSVSLSPAIVSHQRADSAPVMEEYNGTFYVGWTGRNAAHNLNLMTYSPTTKSFGAAQVLTETTVVGSGPGLANFYGNLYVAWQGTDNRLNIGRYNLANPTVLANKVTLNEHSTSAPALAGFNNRLYLGWTGMDGRLNLISSVDGSLFGSKVTYGVVARTSPALAGAGVLSLVWEDVNATASVVVAQIPDPLHSTTLQDVVTTATSQIPVGVASAGVPAPWLRMAWRLSIDEHIHLGIFAGNPVIQNYVYSTQTTLYTPTLFDGAYMTWTGTDDAQSVNVSQVNL
jgi:hypothetical protein